MVRQDTRLAPTPDLGRNLALNLALGHETEGGAFVDRRAMEAALLPMGPSITQFAVARRNWHARPCMPGLLAVA